MIRCAWAVRGLVGVALSAALWVSAAFAQVSDGHRPLTPAEQIYADLAKLDDATRAEKIEEGARKEGELDLASGFAGQIGIDHTKLFENRYPFLKVDRVEQGAEDGAQLFVTESSVGRRLTDVYTFSVASAGDVVRRDLSAHYPTPAEKRVLPAYRGLLDPEHRWIPWIWSELGNSYNSDMLSVADGPKTWLDLCNPRYKGNVSFEPLELRFLAGLDAILGEDKLVQFLQCMGKNAPIIMRGHSARMTLMLAGDHAINSDNYFYEGFKAKRDHHAPFMPIFTAPLMGYGNGVFINKDAVHPYAAALYVDWALSDESQNFAAHVLRNPITQPSPVIPESAPLVTFSFPDDALKDRLENDWKQYMIAK